MTTTQLNSAPPETAELNPAPSGRVPFSTAIAHTWYLTGRKLHALARQPWVLAFSIIQPVIWLFLFGELFRKIIDIPGFAYHGTYLDYLVPGLIAMNAMSNNMWAGMSMIEEIERGTLNRFLASPASRIAIMNATVAEQAVSTTVQSLIIVALGLAGGARYHGGVGGVAVMVAASILLGVVFGALSNVVGMLAALPRGDHRRVHVLHAPADLPVLGVHADPADAGLDAGHRVAQPAQLARPGRPVRSLGRTGLECDRRPLRRPAGARGGVRGRFGRDVPLVPEERLKPAAETAGAAGAPPFRRPGAASRAPARPGVSAHLAYANRR